MVFGGMDTGNGLGIMMFRNVQWSNTTTTGEPSERYLADAAFDARCGVLVLFGGGSPTGPLDETWTFYGTAWVRR